MGPGSRSRCTSAWIALVLFARGAVAQDAETEARLPRASLELKQRVQEVGDPSRERGHAVYQELFQLGERLAPAVPEIAVLLGDERVEVRCWALSLAFALDWEAEPLLPQLLDALREEDAMVQANAAAALGNLGSRAAGAVERLEELIAGDAGESASFSAGALARIDPGRALRHAKPEVRIEALRALNEFGVDFDPGLVPLLLERLGDGDPEVRAGSAVVLGGACSDLTAEERRKIGAAALAALEVETRPDVREWLLYTLGRVPEPDADTVPLLVRLAHEDAGSRLVVVRALNDLGAPAHPAFDFLLETASGADEETRHLAMCVLAQLDPGNPATAAVLAKELERRDLRSSGFVLALQAARHPVDPGLLAACSSADDVVTRRRAVEALGGMGERATSALEAVRARLEDSNAEVRFAATLALLQIDGSFDADRWTQVIDAATGDVVSLRHPALVTLIEGARVKPNLREQVAARLTSEAPLERGLAALALLWIDASDAAALRALLRAWTEAGTEVYPLIREGLLAPCFRFAGPAEKEQLLACLSAVGQDARRELRWLGILRDHAEPELARRIEKAMRCIRGLDSP